MLYKIMLNKFGINDIKNIGVDQNGEIECEVTIPDDFYNTNISENYIPTKFSDYLAQGKSNSHIAAGEDENKVTASVAAKYLSKKFNVKILAKDINHLSNEWHHSGVFKSGNGRTAANKTYFFNKEDLDKITLEQINLKTSDEKTTKNNNNEKENNLLSNDEKITKNNNNEKENDLYIYKEPIKVLCALDKNLKLITYEKLDNCPKNMSFQIYKKSIREKLENIKNCNMVVLTYLGDSKYFKL
jgi:hypothetical protein